MKDKGGFQNSINRAAVQIGPQPAHAVPAVIEDFAITIGARLAVKLELRPRRKPLILNIAGVAKWQLGETNCEILCPRSLANGEVGIIATVPLPQPAHAALAAIEDLVITIRAGRIFPGCLEPLEALLADTLEQARELIPRGPYIIRRQPGDAPYILETWLT